MSRRKTRAPEHGIWAGMLARCFNPHRENFVFYGARGISVCDRWRHGDGKRSGYRCFLADVGPRPSTKHSIDRYDSEGNYEPGNVRWATPLEQANNKRNTRTVVYRGRKMALCDAVRAAGEVIHREAAWVRIKTGWTVEEALETPRLHLSGNSREKRRAA